MEIVLSVLRCPDSVAPQTRRINGGEFTIGRGPDNDWPMTDPDRVLSKRHCIVAFRSGGWQIADVSTNGTFLNGDAEPIGQGQIRNLRDGDRLRLGAYELEVRIEGDNAFRDPGFSTTGQTRNHGAEAAQPRLNPFAEDPFGSPPQHAADAPFPQTGGRDSLGIGLGDGPGLHDAPVSLPPDFDPLSPTSGNDPFAGPTQSDHNPGLEDAFRIPRITPTLPDDWDLDLAPQPIPPPAPAAAFSPTPQPPIVPEQAPPFGPSSLPSPADSAAIPSAPARVSVSADSPDPFAEPSVPAAPQPVSPAPAPLHMAPPASVQAGVPASPQVPGSDLLGAFLHGAGMEDTRPENPQATMEALGQAFRAMVTGLRQALIARASIKGEFRIEQTMIRSRGNNPLKFSAGDDDALGALLGIGRRSDMSPAAAVADALRDMRLHELASVSAMQSAVRALMRQLAPEALRASADQGSITVLPAQKKARAWDAYERLHAATTQALEDDFDSVFGKAFARAYEQALREVADRETGTP
jgi:type VI secretion system protein ImpI